MFQQLSEVHARCTQYSIQTITFVAFEPVSIHPPDQDEGGWFPTFALADVDLDGVLDVALGVSPNDEKGTPAPMHVLLSRPEEETFEHLGKLTLQIDEECEQPLAGYVVHEMRAAHFNDDEIHDFLAVVQAACPLSGESARVDFVILSDP